MENEVKISKFLSLVLRHDPASIGLELDEQGWASVADLLAKIRTKGYHLNLEGLMYLVENNSKKRFAFSDDFKRIRANQGHSVTVDLGYKKQIPPPILFHGTAEKHLTSIQKEGIKKMNRHHVHLSQDVATAQKVGMRHGKPIILVIDTEKMDNQGFDFYLSDNLVWLTDFVPAEFVKVYE